MPEKTRRKDGKKRLGFHRESLRDVNYDTQRIGDGMEMGVREEIAEGEKGSHVFRAAWE